MFFDSYTETYYFATLSVLLNHELGQWVENGSVMKLDFLFCVGFQSFKCFFYYIIKCTLGKSNNLLQKYNFFGKILILVGISSHLKYLSPSIQRGRDKSRTLLPQLIT